MSLERYCPHRLYRMTSIRNIGMICRIIEILSGKELKLLDKNKHDFFIVSKSDAEEQYQKAEEFCRMIESYLEKVEEIGEV